MTQTRADKVALHFWTRLALLGPGDLSVNQAAAAQHEAVMLSGLGSANDALWSDMVELGWTRETMLDESMLPAGTRAFAFTAAGTRVMTDALDELAHRKAALLAQVRGCNPGSTPASVTAVCERLGHLAMKILALLIMARWQAPETPESRVRHAENVASLEEIAHGVERSARAIGDAIAAGPDSDDGRDWLERTVKALDYADEFLGPARA